MMSCGWQPSIVHHTDWAVPRISLTVPASVRAMEGTHGACNVDDLIKVDVTIVLHMLDLLTVPLRFFQGPDYQCRCSGYHGHLCLSVLYSQLYSDLQALPVTSSLGNIITNLLRGETEGTNLGGKGGGCTNLTTHGPHVNDLDFIGVELSCGADPPRRIRLSPC